MKEEESKSGVEQRRIKIVRFNVMDQINLVDSNQCRGSETRTNVQRLIIREKKTNKEGFREKKEKGT